MKAEDAADRARELVRESRFLSFCRIGFLGRGILYILIGFLALGTGRTEDVTGALEYLGHGIGRILLIGIAVGMAAYGLWRLSDAVFAIENPGRSGKALRKRAASAGVGLIYLALCYKAVRILLMGRAGTMSPREQAHTVLGLPGGTWILGLVAIALLVGGALQLRKAGKCAFLDPLDRRAHEPFAKWLGRIGYAARGIVFVTVAYLCARAALDGRSKEAGGMEQALDFLSGPMLWAVAFGLILFGAFSIVEAFFRRMNAPPPAHRIKAIVEEKLT